MLTDAQCRNAVCPPEKKQARFADSGGIYLQVSPAGCLKSPAYKLIHETPAYLVCKAKLISTSSTGTFWAAPTVAVGFAAMVSATSIPFTTRPNTA